ncbi:hypothetical protein JW905_09075 [bacterium]|nr:hypothetical protein [candidate division CSSED10-310 bacterium]
MADEAQRAPGSSQDLLLQIRNGTAPRYLRLLVARGLIPYEGTILLRLLHFLSAFDKDKEVAETALTTLRELPVGTLEVALLDDNTPGEFLHLIAQIRPQEIDLLCALVRHPNIQAKTLYLLAERAPAPVLEAITVNQDRLLNDPHLISLLLANPGTSRFLETHLTEFKELFKEEIRRRRRDRMREKEGGEPEREGPAQATPPDQQEDRRAATASPGVAVETADLEEEAEDLEEEVRFEEEESYEEEAGREEYREDEYGDEDEAFLDEFGEEDEAVGFMDVRTKLRTLPMSDKLMMATMGTKQERYVLIRDPNKKIALAALHSPKITEFEVELVARCRSVNDEILRDIATSKEWSKSYTITSSLVKNPKTPPSVSLRMLSRLWTKDLKDLQQDKDIPYGVRAAAKRLYELRLQRMR